MITEDNRSTKHYPYSVTVFWLVHYFHNLETECTIVGFKVVVPFFLSDLQLKLVHELLNWLLWMNYFDVITETCSF